MKISILVTGHIMLTTFLLVLLSITLPAWSDAQTKPSIKGSEKKEASIKKDDKSILGRKDSEDAAIDGSNKGGSTVKNKVVKKVGAAAAVGIVGKKVTSKIKK
jgi:hypothetical protein